MAAMRGRRIGGCPHLAFGWVLILGPGCETQAQMRGFPHPRLWVFTNAGSVRTPMWGGATPGDALRMLSRAFTSPSANPGETRAAIPPDLDIEDVSAEAIGLMPMSSTFAARPDPPYAGAGR